MLSLLIKNIKNILVWGVLLALITGVISFLIPRYYLAESQVLIIARDRSGADSLSQSKAAENIAQSLATVVPTQDFFNKVMEPNSALQFNRDRFANLTPNQERKRWQRDVQASSVYGTSFLKLSVYSTTKEDSLNFATAITETLVSRGFEYTGSDVTLKVVDAPLLSTWRTRPNIILNTALGFVVGLVLGVWWLWYSRNTRMQ